MTDNLSIPPIPERVSPELERFLRDWLDWAEAGAPDDNPHGFRGVAGLCVNCCWYFYGDVGRPAFLEQLGSMFKVGYPFGGRDEYYSGRPHHTNPQRLAWVRAVLAAGSKEG